MILSLDPDGCNCESTNMFDTNGEITNKKGVEAL